VAEGVRPPLYSEVWRAVFICRRASCPVYSYYESTLTSGGQADISLVGTMLEDKMEILDIRMPAFYLGPSNTAGKSSMDTTTRATSSEQLWGTACRAQG